MIRLIRWAFLHFILIEDFAKKIQFLLYCEPSDTFQLMGLSKSKWGKQPVEDIPIFTCICVCCFVGLMGPNEKNDTDLKFGTHTPRRPYLKTAFLFFEKVTLRTVSLEKLLRHILDGLVFLSFFIYLKVK